MRGRKAHGRRRGATSIEQEVFDRLRALPPEKQQEVLDFAEFLRQKGTAKRPCRALKGLWADLEVLITEEHLAAARREMWMGFPRDDT